MGNALSSILVLMIYETNASELAIKRKPYIKPTMSKKEKKVRLRNKVAKKSRNKNK